MVHRRECVGGARDTECVMVEIAGNIRTVVGQEHIRHTKIKYRMRREGLVNVVKGNGAFQGDDLLELGEVECHKPDVG